MKFQIKGVVYDASNIIDAPIDLLMELNRTTGLEGQDVFDGLQASHAEIAAGRMPGMQAHGFQILVQTAAGAGWFPHLVEESMRGFIEQSSQFLKPVYTGDTLTCKLTVSELAPNRSTGVIALTSTVHNQRGELVMTGVQKYLLKKRGA